MADGIQDTLRQVGVSTATLDRIKLARGLVGKTSYVAGAAIIALGVVAYGLKGFSVFLIADAALIVLLFAGYFGGVLWFAHRHPGVALLEGAELIQWRQMEMAAKSVTPLEQQRNAAPQLLGKE
jgi:hypothetical protein